MLSNVSHHRLTRLLVSVLTTGLMIFGVSMATTSSASAACAYWIPSSNGEGAGTAIFDLNLKNNYYSVCDNVASVSKGTLLYYRCIQYNPSTKHEWVYVRVAGTSTYGWTSRDNIADIGYDDNHDGSVDIAYCN
ncbi:hypothetical protein [Streptomyces sp. NPDC096132]|uniref:hypothetical protein n=1 Tax=Streptomyces sp. NPDC096132 TaxID=3366075 RepID=UPI0037F43EFF